MKLNNIYVLKTYGSDGRVLYKLGYSSNIVERIRSYAYHNPLIELVKTYHFEKGLEFEQYIHNNFKADIRREWYDEETIINIMDNIELIYTKGLSNKFKDCNQFTSFKGRIKELHELYLGDNKLEYLTKYEGAIREYPFLEQAIKDLGYDVMKSNGYRKGNIENMVKYNKIKGIKENSSVKIAKVILEERKIKNGEFYTNAELKKYLTTIHEKLGIEAVAKATDIVEYFSTRKTKRRVDGKGTAGYEILHSLHQLKK